MDGDTLTRALVKEFAWEWVVGGLWRVLQIACQSSVPFVMRAFVTWLSVWLSGEDDKGLGYGLLLGFVLGLLPMLEMVFAERGIWLNVWTSFRIRTCLVLVITRKLLRKRSNEAPVDVANLITMDADRVKESAESLHFLWRTPLLVTVTMTVLGTMLGWQSALGAFGTLVAIVSLTALFNRQFSKLKRQVSAKTDARVSLSTDLVKSLENVKSLALERLFESQILDARAAEVSLLTRYRIFYAVFKSLTMVLSPLVLFTALSIYMLQGRELTAAIVFACLVSVNALQMPFQQAVDVGVSLVETRVALERISSLLACDDASQWEAPDDPAFLCVLQNTSWTWDESGGGTGSAATEQGEKRGDGDHDDDEEEEEEDEELIMAQGISLLARDANASKGSSTAVVLAEVSLFVRCGELVWITGRVGSGKSSLLLSLLGELRLLSGQIRVTSTGAFYCGQNKLAALVTGTLVDNITWGLPFDQTVFNLVCDGCALHTDFEQLVNGSMTVVGESGVNLSGGQRARVCLARSLYAALLHPEEPHLLLLDDPLSAVDVQTGAHLLRFLRGLPRNVGIMMSSHHCHLIEASERVVVLSSGKVVADGNLAQVMTSLDVDLAELFVRDSEDDEQQQQQQQQRQQRHDKGKEEEDVVVDNAAVVSQALSLPFDKASAKSHRGGKGKDESSSMALHAKEGRSKGRVGLAVYRAFFSTAPIRWLMVGLIFLVSFACSIALQLYVAELSSGNGTLLVYVALTGANSLLLVGKLVFIFIQGILSASSFHSTLLHTICRLTKLSVDTNPSGMFIARFTGDIDTIDTKLAVSLEVFVRKMLDLVQLAVLGSISTYGVFAVVTFGVGLGAFLMGRFSTKSSIEIARSCGIVRGPVQSRIVEVSHAMASIRAYQQQQRWWNIITEEVWTVTSCYVMQQAIRRWLNIRLSVLGGMGVWALAFLALLMPNMSSALVALGLAYSLELRQQFNMIIMNSVELENSMQACERIRELGGTMQLEPEGGETLVVDRGAVEFEDVSVVYRPGLPPALSNVSFAIAPGTKVGVCGRTGSGKSTVIRVLLRLLEYQGVVRIDGQDISKVDLVQLRELLPTVTQASLMLRGSVRDAIDPARRLTDDQVLESMQRIGIGHLAMDSAAASLSSGELQLASFCRALAAVEYFGAKFLLLDEASSSIDTISERFMAEVLHTRLKDVTVFIIAHRISSIMSCDQVLVLGDGRILERGSPAQLNVPGTGFYELVRSQNDY